MTVPVFLSPQILRTCSSRRRSKPLAVSSRVSYCRTSFGDQVLRGRRRQRQHQDGVAAFGDRDPCRTRADVARRASSEHQRSCAPARTPEVSGRAPSPNSVCDTCRRWQLPRSTDSSFRASELSESMTSGYPLVDCSASQFVGQTLGLRQQKPRRDKRVPGGY